jgi:hypothetical protein
MTLPIKAPKGAVNHAFASNTDTNGVHGIVWHIIVTSQGDDVPKDIGGITNWAQEAHVVAKSWFSALSRGKLMENFSREEKSVLSG